VFAVRRDAAQRREALIEAAEACFREFGYLIPLEQIADRAGVGRGTLYRNFPSRAALGLAVFEREVDEISIEFSSVDDIELGFRRMIQRAARSAAFYNRIAADFQSEQNSSILVLLTEKATAGWQPVIERGRAQGIFGPHVGPRTLMMVSQLVAGLIARLQSETEISEGVDEALDLVMRGLRPD
jgi:AcrR family transcriptional regulator